MKRKHAPHKNASTGPKVRPPPKPYRKPQQVAEASRQREETQSEKNKRPAENRKTAEPVDKSKKEEQHGGRISSPPRDFPDEFLCIHCNKRVKKEENTHPGVCQKHRGVLRPEGFILRAPRFKQGEWEEAADEFGSKELLWSCCGRGEKQGPPKDFSKCDPELRKHMLNPPPTPCPATFHEPEVGA
ncbi:hypothetical protein F4678DRAFT_480785 [Xylaria arbuscula]|nr:hypothetical protein F4678DRAFT_480785 [Xylaria arbuscula]